MIMHTTARMLLISVLLILLCTDEARGVGSVEHDSLKLSKAARMTFLGFDLEDAFLSPTTFNSGSPHASAYQVSTFTCDGVMDGEDNPCIVGMNMTMTPYYPRNVTAPGGNTPLDPDTQGTVYVEWMNDTLNDIRRTCGQIDSCGNMSSGTYVYVLPFYQFCPANAQCGVSVNYMFDEDVMGSTWSKESMTNSSDIRIRNKFNSSTISYRELYGVPDEYQGTESVWQASSVPYRSGLQVEQVYEYLNALNLTYNELDFWGGTYNNESLCEPTKDNPNADCAEQLLDVTTMMGMAPLAFNSYLPINTDLEDVGYMEMLVKLIDESDTKPDVISLSFGNDFPGGNMTDLEENIGRLEELMENLAMMNITIVVGPGDVGAAGNDAGGCVTKEQGGLFQTWPGMSPWVVSVGATMLQTLEPGADAQEVVATGRDTGITTAGGFSGKAFGYSTPSWQQSAVESYLSKTGPEVFAAFPTVDTAPAFNPSGRGFPDVSVMGWGQMLGGPDEEPIGPNAGTSLAAPIAASLFTLANQKLKSEGYDTIGYANPMLYWMGESCPEAFNDVVFGNNTGDGFGDAELDCGVGYPAAPGWDAASGWGSINFIPFVECAMKYQDLKKGATDASSSAESPSSSALGQDGYAFSGLILSTLSLLFWGY